MSVREEIVRDFPLLECLQPFLSKSFTMNNSLEKKTVCSLFEVCSLFQENTYGTFLLAQGTVPYREQKFFHCKKIDPNPSQTCAAQQQGLKWAAAVFTASLLSFEMFSWQH